MPLRAEDERPIPEEARRVARAAFPKSTLATRIADQLGAIYQDEEFAGLLPPRGQPTLSPGRLALVTVLQFAEGLSGRQAADAVRGRIDWKLSLPRLGGSPALCVDRNGGRWAAPARP